MGISYSAKDSDVLAQQLKVQEVTLFANNRLVSVFNSDLLVTINEPLTGVIQVIKQVAAGTVSGVVGLVHTTNNQIRLIGQAAEPATTSYVIYYTTKEGIATPTPMVGPVPVYLGMAANYTILTKSGISTVPTSSITGDIAVSPIAHTAITGFSLVLDGGGQFATSSQVTGKVYAADYAAPTPANLTQAVLDMQNAYTDASTRATPDFTDIGAGNLGGLSLTPGLYKFTTGVTIPTNVTLNGGANDTYIFQIPGTLTLAAATSIILAGGLSHSNIVWAVAGAVSTGTTSVFNGNILAATSIALGTGATMNGRLLAQTAATLDSDTVIA